MTEPPPSDRVVSHAGVQRTRLVRMVNAVQRPSTQSELEELELLLKRANPERNPGLNAHSRFIGMNALTLTQRTLRNLRPDWLVFNKVNGIGALGAMFNPANRSKATNSTATTASNTMLFIRRNGIFAVDDVALPLRHGRVLIDGELCIRRRRLSASEKAKLKAIPCVVGFDYLESDDGSPENDKHYELCFAAHDLLVDDHVNVASARLRTGDAAYLQEPMERLMRLLALTQCSPMCDEQTEEAIAAKVAEFTSANKQPSVTVFCKLPYTAGDLLWRKTLQHCLEGVELDGLMFMPGRGQYMIAQPNPDLLKFKAWRDNTGDFVFVRGPDGVYRFFVLNANNVARCISTRLWLGDTDEERAISQAALDAEATRLANGGDPNRPHIFECEPSLAAEDRDTFFALIEQEFPSEEARLLVAGELLRWRPIGVMREDKLFPNSEINFWNIVNALLYCVTIGDLVKQVGRK